MLSFALSMVAAASLAAGWEPIVDPALGVEILRPAGWAVQALANDTIVVRAPPPLGGSVTIVPLRGRGLTGRALVAEVTRSLGAESGRELEMSTGHAALIRYVDPVEPQVERTALVIAAVREERAVLSVLSAPSAEFAAARPALMAIVQHLKLKVPAAEATPCETKAVAYEPFNEPKEQAFRGELPVDWEKELSVAIVPGDAPHVRASVIGRSQERQFVFAHYKLAAFQEPVDQHAPSAKSARAYEAGALVLENFLFPKAVEKAPAEFANWKITRRSGSTSLYAHESGVQFDGELVDYEYLFRGELLHGKAFAVTYRLPTKPTAHWFLYGLFGWEAPASRESGAHLAALQLLRTFSFEGRYATQADLFWTLARDGALKALTSSAPTPLSTGIEPVIARYCAAPPKDAVERASIEMGSSGTGDSAMHLEVGVSRVALEGQPSPTPAVLELEKLQ